MGRLWRRAVVRPPLARNGRERERGGGRAGGGEERPRNGRGTRGPCSTGGRGSAAARGARCARSKGIGVHQNHYSGFLANHQSGSNQSIKPSERIPCAVRAGSKHQSGGRCGARRAARKEEEDRNAAAPARPRCRDARGEKRPRSGIHVSLSLPPPSPSLFVSSFPPSPSLFSPYRRIFACPPHPNVCLSSFMHTSTHPYHIYLNCTPLCTQPCHVYPNRTSTQQRYA